MWGLGSLQEKATEGFALSERNMFICNLVFPKRLYLLGVTFL